MYATSRWASDLCPAVIHRIVSSDIFRDSGLDYRLVLRVEERDDIVLQRLRFPLLGFTQVPLDQGLVLGVHRNEFLPVRIDL